MKHLITILFATIAVATAAAFAGVTVGDVSADYGCAPYGGECPTSSHIVIDKLIRDPRSKGEVYVDNLLLSDYRFSTGEDIFFKIVVKNTGNTTIDNVVIHDTIPNVTNYMLLSGEPRNSIRDINNSIGSMSPDETREWFIRVRVKPENEIPEGIVCGDPHAINRARVSANDMPDSHDASSFCVTTKVKGATTQQPRAGSELIILAGALTSLTGIGLAGRKIVG